MNTEDTSATPQYKPVTVDVPEDRVPEFYAFFARFLSGKRGRRRGGPEGERHGDRHGHGREHESRCRGRRERVAGSEPTPASTEA